MAEVLGAFTFEGRNGKGVVSLGSVNGLQGGDRVLSMCNITTGVNNPSVLNDFSHWLPNSGNIVQDSSADLTGNIFLAIIVRD